LWPMWAKQAALTEPTYPKPKRLTDLLKCESPEGKLLSESITQSQVVLPRLIKD
jgi:hypothetical protein